VADTTVNISGLVPNLEAISIAETIAFYCDTLGFEVTSVYPDADEPIWCAVKRGEALIMFSQAHKHEHEPGEEHDHPESPVMTGSLYLYPDDIDTLWEQIKDRVEVAWPIQDRDYGIREFGIQDPNGYILSFGETSIPDHVHADEDGAPS